MRRLVTKPLHWANQGFMLIAEPRMVRVMQFGIYLCMVTAGVFILTAPPWSLRDVLGQFLVIVLGAFITIGAAFGLVAVLPGIWWLERVAILALGTGLAMYAVAILAQGAPWTAFAIGVGLTLSLVQRWMEIRKFQLAPKRG